MDKKVPFFETEKRPGVGISVVIERDGKYLLGKRKGSHGEGTWAFPGGKLDWYESFETCAERETREETGLRVANVRQAGMFTNDVFEEDAKHFVTLFVQADYTDGEATVLEPEKCETWEWFAWDDFPTPLFKPIVQARAAGFDPRRAAS